MEKYSKKFVTLHWLHAAILAFMLIGATLKLPDLPKVGGDLAPFKMHIIVGLIALVLLIVRVLMVKKEPDLKIYNSAKDIIVKWNHRLIYLFILIVAVSGIATAKLSNLGSVVLFGAEPTEYTGATPLVENLASIHSASTTILMALIAMHVIGVVFYIISTKDNIIKRMWF